jgi:Protein of unknown function (DUF2637)
LTAPNKTPHSGPGPPDGGRTEGMIQVVIMLAIGAAAGAASFTHVHQVAAAHGQPGWLAWADAVVLELTSIASGLELRRRKRVGKSPLFPASMLSIGVVLSLSAQVVQAEPSVIGWLAAALPAAGFLAMVKIAMGRADPGPAHLPGGPVPDELGPDPDTPDRSGTARTVPDDVTALLPTARAVAASLAAQGITLSRTSLSARLRAEGHSLSSATASALVRILRTDPGLPGTAEQA